MPRTKTATPKIEVGQVWERNRDGVRVEIVGYDEEWNDCKVRWVDDSTKAYAVFGWNLVLKYTLVVPT